MTEFKALRLANVARCRAFGHKLEDWPPERWALAIAGETGELCNLVKKMIRGDDVGAGELRDEVADILIYLDLFAARCGFDLAEVVVEKFNRVSDRVCSPVKLDLLDGEMKVSPGVRRFCETEQGNYRIGVELRAISPEDLRYKAD